MKRALSLGPFLSTITATNEIFIKILEFYTAALLSNSRSNINKTRKDLISNHDEHLPCMHGFAFGISQVMPASMLWALMTARTGRQREVLPPSLAVQQRSNIMGI